MSRGGHLDNHKKNAVKEQLRLEGIFARPLLLQFGFGLTELGNYERQSTAPAPF